jgi:hypothetical protein
MKTGRNIANVARVAEVAKQNMQELITDSLWPGEKLIAALQQDITALPYSSNKQSQTVDDDDSVRFHQHNPA